MILSQDKAEKTLLLSNGPYAVKYVFHLNVKATWRKVLSILLNPWESRILLALLLNIFTYNRNVCFIIF